MKYYSAIKKEENSAIWNNKNGPWGLYAKWNKLEKENHCISTLSCGIWKKKQTHGNRE